MSTPMQAQAQRQLEMYDQGFVVGVAQMVKLQFPEYSESQLKAAVIQALEKMQVYDKFSYMVQDLLEG